MSTEHKSTIIQPRNDSKVIYKNVSDKLLLATTTGLVKGSNEDRIGYAKGDNRLLVALADGHWGDQAAQLAVPKMLSLVAMPTIDQAAIKQAVLELQDTLWQLFSSANMDQDTTKTPETSLMLAIIDYSAQQLTLAGYGDCRAIVVRDNQLLYSYTTQPTWLGAFSAIGMRDRLSVAKALTIDSVPLNPGDRIVLYTDGVDESVYEVPTIDVFDYSCQEYKTINDRAQALMDKIVATGAQDNASFAIIEL